ncbi:hypothetical protein [Georgenia yuyongxinii]
MADVPTAVGLTPAVLRHHFAKTRGLSPQRCRRRFSAVGRAFCPAKG